MKLYSYQGKQWVIQGEFAVELGIGRHDLERETRQQPFRRNHVVVLRDTNRKAFLKANGITRGGGPIALVEKSGAEQIWARIKGKPVQTVIPFPAPVDTPFKQGTTVLADHRGKDRLQVLTATFRGDTRAFIELNGQRCIPSTSLGWMLGYRPPSALTNLVRREWRSEFVERVDYALLIDENLNNFKACVKLTGITHAVRARTSVLLVLFESGVNKVLLKTNRPDGVAVRDFLAKEVMPTLSRVEPKTFFLNEQHELPPQPKPAPTPATTPAGMVSGGLSDRGAERFHQAITLNTSFALADKLVQAGQLTNQDATAVQVSLVKEFGGVDLFQRAKDAQTERFVGLGVHLVGGKADPKTVTYPAPPEKVPAPKQALLPKVTVAEEWTLETNPDAVVIAEAARILSKDAGREITPGRIKTMAIDLRIHLHHRTRSRARTDPGPPFVRRQDIVRMHKYLLEHPTLYVATSTSV